MKKGTCTSADYSLLHLFSFFLLLIFSFAAIAPSLDSQTLQPEMIELLDGAEGEERDIIEADSVDEFFHFSNDALTQRNDRGNQGASENMGPLNRVFLPVPSPPPEA